MQADDRTPRRVRVAEPRADVCGVCMCSRPWVRRSHCLKGWELMLFCLACFPPSKALKNFLVSFFKENAETTEPKSTVAFAFVARTCVCFCLCSRAIGVFTVAFLLCRSTNTRSDSRLCKGVLGESEQGALLCLGAYVCSGRAERIG